MSEPEAPPPALELYRARLLAQRKAHQGVERIPDRLGNVRLGLALASLGLLMLPLLIRSGGPWWALIPMAVGFLVLGAWHDRVGARSRRLAASLWFLEREVDRIEENWRSFEDDGADLAPFGGAAGWDVADEDTRASDTVYLAGDLDLFGPGSLFQLLSRAVTRHGRRTLARWLCGAASPEVIRARQQAVRELAERLDQREAIAVAVAGERALPLREERLLDWAERLEPVPFGPLLKILGIVQPILVIATGSVVAVGGPGQALFVAILAQAATLLLTKNLVNDRAAKLSTPDRALTRFSDVIEVIEKTRFEAPALNALKERLLTEGVPASARIRELKRLVEMLDARLNLFFALSFGPVLLWDLNIVLRAEAWQRRWGKNLRRWIEAIGELEALASLAGLAHARPDYAMPELVDGPGVFRASGLAHPLIDRRNVVANELELGGPGSVLLLSGSNMSGKSTLLRAVGINVILAQAGAPVAARALAISPTSLVTSIQVVDSLRRGTSHFYAELLRIKLVLERAGERHSEVLYLLDEMLQGTNSKERYIAALSVIRWLSQQGAMGIVTTHDLGLAKVEGELPTGRVINRHFGDEIVGDQMRFDYLLRPGPVQSTNALRLMRAIGITIDLSTPES